MNTVIDGVSTPQIKGFSTPQRESEIATRAQQRRRKRIAFLVWLRRIHMWVGLWGALLGFLFGATGILLNHRAILKIPIEKVVQSSAQLPLPEREFKNPDQIAAWLQDELNFASTHTIIKVDPPKTVTWLNREVAQPVRWNFNLNSPHLGFTAEYFVGNRFITVETRDATPIGTLTRLHMSVGVNAFWVLLADTIAGAFIVLSITGLLLWSRLHPIKLSAVCVSLTALTSGIFFMLWNTL